MPRDSGHAGYASSGHTEAVHFSWSEINSLASVMYYNQVIVDYVSFRLLYIHSKRLEYVFALIFCIISIDCCMYYASHKSGQSLKC